MMTMLLKDEMFWNLISWYMYICKREKVGDIWEEGPLIKETSVQFSSVQFSLSVMSDCLWPHASQHARPPCPSLSLGVCSNSHPLSRWYRRTISSSVSPSPHALNLSHHQDLFQWMSQLFASGGQSIRASASASALPMDILDGFPLGWTGWISLQSKGLSRVFSNTTVQKFQFFSTQPSLRSNSHMHIRLLEKL